MINVQTFDSLSNLRAHCPIVHRTRWLEAAFVITTLPNTGYNRGQWCSLSNNIVRKVFKNENCLMIFLCSRNFLSFCNIRFYIFGKKLSNFLLFGVIKLTGYEDVASIPTRFTVIMADYCWFLRPSNQTNFKHPYLKGELRIFFGGGSTIFGKIDHGNSLFLS